MSDRPPLPNFIIIGAQKAGTRWLASNLSKHPEVFVASGEPSFFQSWPRVRDEGLDSYREHFREWSAERAIGESTPAYLMYHCDPAAVAERIDRWLPGVRLLAILRDPVERAQSALVHHIERGRIARGSKLVDLIRRYPPGPHELHRTGMAWGGPEALISGGWYGESLGSYVARFGDRLSVMLNDDIAEDAVGTYGRVCSHLGVDPDFLPDGLTDVVFSNRRGEETRLPEADRAQIAPWFSADIGRLERLIGRDLSAWRR